jgi:YggT family protein
MPWLSRTPQAKNAALTHPRGTGEAACGAPSTRLHIAETTEPTPMIPLLNFIAMVITLYMWVIIISAILSWLIAFNVVNRSNQFVYTVADSLYRITEPALRPIRRALPDFGGLDLSPVVLILGLIFLRDVVIHGWLYPAFI